MYFKLIFLEVFIMVKKRFVRVGIMALAVLVLCVVTSCFVFKNGPETLPTLEKLDDYPFYSMTYKGDYGLDDFLADEAENNRDFSNFDGKKLLKGDPINVNISDAGSMSFSAKNEQQERIYGRIFEFTDSPSLLLRTNPENGYASISMVSLMFMGYSKEKGLEPRSMILVSPYFPLDGMNEKGLVVSIQVVPKLNSLMTLPASSVVRLLLDKAATVNEAISLVETYNVNFSFNMAVHYLIADKSGNTALIEYRDNKMNVVKTDEPYHIATNEVSHNRYDIVEEHLSNTQGIISDDDAMQLLDDAKTINHPMKLTPAWSVVYNQEKLTAEVCIGRNFQQKYEFAIYSDSE
jgi:hypothetical protein